MVCAKLRWYVDDTDADDDGITTFVMSRCVDVMDNVVQGILLTPVLFCQVLRG